MGYDTYFEGEFQLDRPLSNEHFHFLREFAMEEHDPDEEGTPAEEESSGRPCPYCQWTPSEDGTEIQWDSGEKFYGWLEWLHYLVEHRLQPWGYRLNGQVRWRGEDVTDGGTIYVKDNRIEAVPDVNPGPSWDRAYVPTAPS